MLITCPGSGVRPYSLLMQAAAAWTFSGPAMRSLPESKMMESAEELSSSLRRRSYGATYTARTPRQCEAERSRACFISFFTGRWKGARTLARACWRAAPAGSCTGPGGLLAALGRMMAPSGASMASNALPPPPAVRCDRKSKPCPSESLLKEYFKGL